MQMAVTSHPGGIRVILVRNEDGDDEPKRGGSEIRSDHGLFHPFRTRYVEYVLRATSGRGYLQPESRKQESVVIRFAESHLYAHQKHRT